MSFRPGISIPGAFTYNLRRGISENYLMTLCAGSLYVYDLMTGNGCSITDNTAGDGYLASAPSGVLDVDNFRAQTIDDTTFILNKSKIPAFTSATAPVRPHEALIFVKQGGYSLQYEVAVGFGGVIYLYSYYTPDNGSAVNGPFTHTDHISATLLRAMTNTVATNSAFAIPGSVASIGASDPGDTGGSGGVGTGQVSVVTTPGIYLNNEGFSFQINGNLIRIYRTDGQDFTIDVNDGAGGSLISAFKDTVQSFQDLPEGGFDGMVLQVVGTAAQSLAGTASAAAGSAAGSYWVQYAGPITSKGYWQEVPAPGVHTTLDQNTMPHSIFTPSPGTFQINKNTWQPRISGDGINTALDPSFVGNPTQSIGFYQGRLEIIWEGGVTWSQTNNEFAFFPATSQETLDTDPIDIKLASNEFTALLRAAVTIDESHVLWGQLAQFRVNSGVATFTPTTIQYPESTNYEFNEGANFARVTSGVYFSFEPSSYATVLNLQYQQGRATGQTDITAHVPAYIPAGVRYLSCSEQLGMMFIRTDGAQNNLYMYSYVGAGDSLSQSAWNTWRLPDGYIRYHGVYRQVLYVLLERADGLALMKYPLNLYITDAGQTQGLTRLDMRITEASTTMSYANDKTTITLPYAVGVDETSNYRIVIRTAGARPRGYQPQIVSVSGSTVIVKGDLTSLQFYAGFRICSKRTESEFFLRTSTGAIPTERLNVKNFVINVEETGYSRVEVTQGNRPTVKRKIFNPASIVPNLGADVVLGKGAIIAPCDYVAKDLTVETINDSPYPSRWTSTEWQYVGTERPTPMLQPSGGPVQ